MPLVLNNPKTVTVTDSSGNVVETVLINAIKIVAAPSDNDLNITTAFIEEGNYDSTSKQFTAYRRLPEVIMDAASYGNLMADAKAIYDGDPTVNSNPAGIYIAQKLASYNFLANQLSLQAADYSIV